MAAKEEEFRDGSSWWLESGQPPIAFRDRDDLVFEVEDASSTRRGGFSTMTREVYILFSDYSQRIITAQYDQSDPGNPILSQRHRAPPAVPSKVDLEVRHEQIGAQIVVAAESKVGTCVGSGTSFALVESVLKTVGDCLPSAGRRSHGAPIYSNIGNSSVAQFDEIRPGDIVAFRHAVFQSQGGLRGKVVTEAGKPDHVAIVQEWNGSKRKLKVVEQRVDQRRVGHNSYRVSDLKSGEVHVFRPMPRSWVDW
jgi:myosin tail region-interacting protein MTI1